MEPHSSRLDETLLPTGLYLGTGIVLNERYELRGRLGAGGFARVWRANHLYGSFDVALKFIEEDTLDEGQTEFQTLKELFHPNIVRILDMGKVTHSSAEKIKPNKTQFYLSMELVEGKTFRELIAEPTTYTAEQCFEWLKQIANALQYLHRLGIKHRDIKPGNLMVDLTRIDHRAVLIDFNIVGIDHPGVGSPAYKCPQVLNEGRWTNFADVWALAVTMYEITTRENLFEDVPDLDVPLDGVPISGFPIATFEAIKRIIRCDEEAQDNRDYQNLFKLEQKITKIDRIPECIKKAFGVSSKNEEAMVVQLLRQADWEKPKSRSALAREYLESINRPAQKSAVSNLERAVYSLKGKDVINYSGSAKIKRVVLTKRFIAAYEKEV